MEIPAVPSDSLSDSERYHYEPTLTQERAKAMLHRYEEEREEARRKRRTGRPKGELTDSLVEKLRNCNILQLRNVKKRCDRLIARQRRPPVDRDCGARYTMRVLASIPVKNERFRLEYDRSSLKDPKVYAKGPYVRRYWWDGDYVKVKYVKRDKQLRKNLPKKVWNEFRQLLNDPNIETIRKQLTECLRRGAI